MALDYSTSVMMLDKLPSRSKLDLYGVCSDEPNYTRSSPPFEWGKVNTSFATHERRENFNLQSSPVFIVPMNPQITSILTNGSSPESPLSLPLAESHIYVGISSFVRSWYDTNSSNILSLSLVQKPREWHYNS